MNVTRSIRPAALFLALLLVGTTTASASANTHPARRCIVPNLTGVTLHVARQRLTRAHCQTGRIHRPKATAGNLIVSRQAPKAHAHRKHDANVTLWLRPKPVKTTTTTPTTTIASPTAVRASIDPSYTLDVSTPQAPPVPVTIDYSATDANSSTPLPDGELTLNIYVAGQAASSYGCEANVGGTITAATCDVELPKWGKYNLIVSYSSGVSNVAATGETSTIDVEPPAPVPVTADQTATGTWPADSPTIMATVAYPATSAQITLTDPAGFNGAASVGLTDDLGDTCTATVTGTTATCTMPVTGTPTTFTITYPGSSATSTAVTSTPDGWGDGQNIVTTTVITTTWPAVSYPVPAAATTVTVTPPPVTITWDGCYYQTGVACPTDGPVSITAGDHITLDAVGIATANPTVQAPGALDFVMSSMTGVTMTDDTSVTTSPDCDAMSSYPGGAWGDCRIVFADPGTYTVQANYVSSDLGVYPDETGPTFTVNVN